MASGAEEGVSGVDGPAVDADALVAQIRQWGQSLGFDTVGVDGIDLAKTEPGLLT